MMGICATWEISPQPMMPTRRIFGSLGPLVPFIVPFVVPSVAESTGFVVPFIFVRGRGDGKSDNKLKRRGNS